MAHALVDFRSLPVELRPYLDGLVRRARSVCEPHLISVFAVGSIALDDYRHGRSDVDVVMVADPRLPARALRELAEALAHPALACPAAGLELVVYGADFAADPCGAAGYLMDLNTGPMLPNRVSFDPSESSAFWYVIDRSIAHQAGRLLHGKPVREVMAAPSPRDVYAALRASVREHAGGEGHLGDNRVLNGCRTASFCRTSRWLAKRRAAQLIAAQETGFRPLIEAALHSFQQPRSAALHLPSADVRAFLSWVEDCVVEAANRSAAGDRWGDAGSL
ncbi:aminoglycoside adenylyltransferase domain-containing protein [Nocardia sp. CY41]|uniref:aminoglycoside adenylyltransferase domain-containing protein n=1 Tax=Nocardia sp. CY41 TaxID=2608686 RepID=UPI001358580D|nr:aminoglycoside adenylyltransferase domain-containing protein [Nocardia sp. CY41]